MNGRDLRATDEPVQRLREHRREDRRADRRPECRRHRLAHGAGRADRERARRCATATGWRTTCARSISATNGRVAYVYVPNTAEPGHAYFKRYFYPQAHKDAIIVDERFNGGGQVADYYIDILRRPLVSYWAMRYGADLKTPTASIQGPKVMIIDETAGSGGDLLPWMFRKFKLGPIVGKRTWGGLVGILGFPEFIDGGRDHRAEPRDLDRRTAGSSRTKACRRTSTSSRRRRT